MAKVERAIRVEALDQNTCGFCDDVEGIVVEIDSPEFEEYQPPNGCEGADLCRGVYAFIRIDEPVKPLITPRRKLPKIVKPFVPTVITPQEIRIEDQLDARLGLTDRELKSIIKIEKKLFSFAETNNKPAESVIIKMRNGKKIILYNRVPVKNLIASEQEFLKELISHYDKGLGNLDKVDRIIIEFKKKGKSLGYFGNDINKTMGINIKNVMELETYTSVYNVLYHETTHAKFYDIYGTALSLRQNKAGMILKEIGELGDKYKRQIERGLSEVLTQETYLLTSGEELLARWVGMIKHKDITGAYLADDIITWGQMTPEIRKILMKEGLL